MEERTTIVQQFETTGKIVKLLSSIMKAETAFRCIVVALVMLFAATSAAETSSYPAASVCAECHRETYDSWSRTFHALSFIDPVFQESLARAELSGEERKRICLSCHAPVINVLEDFSLDTPAVREGVACTFCHTVSALDLDRRLERFTNDTSLVRLDQSGRHAGDLADGRALRSQSRFCAGCHEWTNSLGLKVLSTYSEWLESSYPGEGVSCQHCHMPAVVGGGPVEAGKKVIRPSNLHFQMGGHSQDQLVTASTMAVTAAVEGEQIFVETVITNLKAGHKLPTGIPNRKMKLVVHLYDRNGQVIDSDEAVYSRVVVDGEGRVLEDITDQFLFGVREQTDSRISPREARKERFAFSRSGELDFVLVEASLIYEILTPFLNPQLLSFDIDRKRVPLSLDSAARRSSTVPSLAIIAVVFITVTAVMVSLFRKRTA